MTKARVAKRQNIESVMTLTQALLTFRQEALTFIGIVERDYSPTTLSSSDRKFLGNLKILTDSNTLFTSSMTAKGAMENRLALAMDIATFYETFTGESDKDISLMVHEINSEEGPLSSVKRFTLILKTYNNGNANILRREELLAQPVGRPGARESLARLHSLMFELPRL